MPPKIKKFKTYEGNSMAHAWKEGTGFGPAGHHDADGIQEGTTTWHAACQDCPGSGWMGPNRTVREQAQADADAHNESRPGHNAMVI